MSHTRKFEIDGAHYTVICNDDWSGHALIMFDGGRGSQLTIPGKLLVAAARDIAMSETIVALDEFLTMLRKSQPKVAQAPEPVVQASEPVPMILYCPLCHFKHVDEGEFATKPHHTHSCQGPKCGLTWRPALVPTVGVEYLPGYKNTP
jgi:hypothetical protein